MKRKTLTPELFERIDSHWRAANHLSVGQTYLCQAADFDATVRAVDVSEHP